MFSISPNGVICMNKCDSWKTSIFVNIGTALEPIGYDLGDNDYLYFGVMEPNQPFKDALICKKMDKNDRTPVDPESLDDRNHDGYKDGCVDIIFGPKDTEHVLPGVYYYEVKLLRPVTDPKAIEKGITESIDTIIPRTKFVILD